MNTTSKCACLNHQQHFCSWGGQGFCYSRTPCFLHFWAALFRHLRMVCINGPFTDNEALSKECFKHLTVHYSNALYGNPNQVDAIVISFYYKQSQSHGKLHAHLVTMRRENVVRQICAASTLSDYFGPQNAEQVLNRPCHRYAEGGLQRKYRDIHTMRSDLIGNKSHKRHQLCILLEQVRLVD